MFGWLEKILFQYWMAQAKESSHRINKKYYYSKRRLIKNKSGKNYIFYIVF